MSENNNNNNENKYNIIGIPDLDDIEIPDETPSTKKRNNHGPNFKNLTSEEIKKMLPPELLNAMKEGMGADFLNNAIEESLQLMQNMDMSKFGRDMNTDIEMLKDAFKKIKENPEESSISISFSLPEESENDEEEIEEDENPKMWDREFLEKDIFGSIQYLPSDHLYEEFTDKYGHDPKKYLDLKDGVQKILLSPITSKLNLNNTEELHLCYETDEYILFFARPKPDPKLDAEDQEFGFFIAAIKQPNGEFAFLIPEYGNTFYYDKEEDDVDLYTQDYATDFFVDDSGHILNELYNMINFSIKFMLSPTKSFLLSPAQFGTIRNQKFSVSRLNDGFLKVGQIESNESAEAILFKKDADLPVDQKVFDFYINFGDISFSEKNIIADALFKTNLNDSEAIKSSELKFTSDGKLYIDFDISHLEK